MKTDNKKEEDTTAHGPKYPIQSNLMKTIQNLAAAAALKTTKTTIEAFTADLQSRAPDADVKEYGSEMLSAIFLSSHSFLKRFIQYTEEQADMITSSMILASQGLDPTEMEWGVVQKTAERIVDEADAEEEEEAKGRK